MEVARWFLFKEAEKNLKCCTEEVVNRMLGEYEVEAFAKEEKVAAEKVGKSSTAQLEIVFTD